MNNYTVLLLRPDYIVDVFGQDTYLAHVVANGVEEAQKLAQMEAFEADVDQDDRSDFRDDASDDYYVLFVAVGHLEDQSVGSTNEKESV